MILELQEEDKYAKVQSEWREKSRVEGEAINLDDDYRGTRP